MSRGDRRINAKSIMGVMMLAAGLGSEVEVETSSDEQQVGMDAILPGLPDKFGEGESEIAPTPAAVRVAAPPRGGCVSPLAAHGITAVFYRSAAVRAAANALHDPQGKVTHDFHRPRPSGFAVLPL
jgi:hypothetical protein